MNVRDTLAYTHVDSPFGALLVAGDEGGLKLINFQAGSHRVAPEGSWRLDERFLAEAIGQLRAYFAGEMRSFHLRLAPVGTPFQQRVWKSLLTIPYGTTISYGELARRTGNPRASRAVGAANGRNPLPIVIPCHRVIGAGGKLTGYGGGLPIKEALLALEHKDR